jgi:hypothetical protein
MALLGGALHAYAQSAPAPDLHRLEISLERETEGLWKEIDPGLVLDTGDRLRFRFRADFAGYLYVMNQGTSGKYELLFPREETGEENRIEPGQEYRIPATQAWFKVDGPAGHDIVYWLVTPLKLAPEGGAPTYVPLPPPPDLPVPPKSLRPRCDDAILRARGDCVDSSAGLRGVDEESVLPENLSGIPRLRSRELVIVRKGTNATVSAPSAAGQPVLYEFRLAHK